MIKADAFNNPFMTFLLPLCSIYNDSVDRQLSLKQEHTKRITGFSSITPPGDYILEKSVNDMNVIYNATSENSKRHQTQQSSNPFPISSAITRAPFTEVGDSKIPKSNQNAPAMPPNQQTTQTKRLSQQSSTPNRRLPKQNAFKNENSY